VQNLSRVVASPMLISKQQHYSSVVVDIVCFQLANLFPWGYFNSQELGNRWCDSRESRVSGNNVLCGIKRNTLATYSSKCIGGPAVRDCEPVLRSVLWTRRMQHCAVVLSAATLQLVKLTKSHIVQLCYCVIETTTIIDYNFCIP